ncbi:MAG: cob(I)yrinic acid a,c-diamide adenosyltransferase [Marinilabiliaceae bacterium]|nr:cob(I)yrinic acid a,c-diamide adenosyltransferase [Marinilabiliaceae bacterium]
MKKSQVYTKGGDSGKTSLIGGTRVSKNNDRLEAYGTIDELNSFIGTIWAFDIEPSVKEFIWKIQNQLFVIGAYLATDDSVSDLKQHLKADNNEIELLELEMDRMESDLQVLTNFVLPGGHQAVSACHICRTVCRRAERRIISLSDVYNVDPWVIKYVNRLSDYLFVLSRYLSNYFEVDEIRWKPNLF